MVGTNEDIDQSAVFRELLGPVWAIAMEGPNEDRLTEFIEIRARFAKHFGNLALSAYKSGELDLLQTLHWVSRISGSNPEEERRELLGDVATRAIALGKPRLLNAPRPRYPKAIRDFAVDQVLMVKAEFPEWPLISTYDRPKKSVIGMVVGLLAIFGVCPPPPRPGVGTWDRTNGPWDLARRQGPTPELLKPSLSHRTLHRWYLERAHSMGAVSPRGRQRR